MKLNWYSKPNTYYGIYCDTFEEYFNKVNKLRKNFGSSDSDDWLCDTQNLAVGYKRLSTLCVCESVRVIPITSSLFYPEERLSKRREIIEWVEAAFPDGGCIFSREFVHARTIGYFVFDDESVETMIRLRWSEELAE